MDDFNLGNLNEARNEWSARLVNIINPFVIEGFNSIYKDAYKLCLENDEEDKYLMTFQNFLTRIPKWNPDMINNEVKRILEKSGCDYLEDLITCVHIVQLKALTCIRVGNKQKKIDIDIPKLDNFIHKIYILVARKLYTNIYLFESDLSPLEKQKNNRELELIVKESILNAIRESIPIEQILRNYLDETVEEDITVTEELIKKDIPKDSATKLPTALDQSIKTESIKTELPPSLKLVEELKPETLKIKSDDKIKLDIKELSPAIADVVRDDVENKPLIKFNDIDKAISEDNIEEKIIAPKTIERLEDISTQRNEQRKAEEAEEEDNDKIKILDSSSNVSSVEKPLVLDNIITLN